MLISIIIIIAIISGSVYVYTNIISGLEFRQNEDLRSITLIYPNGGEVLKKGNKYLIRWESKNIDNYKISIHIRRVPPPPLIEEGQEFNPIIFINLENTRLKEWTVADMYPEGNYIVEINGYNSIPITMLISDNSNSSFEIKNP